MLQALEKEDFQAAFILNPPKAADILTIANGGEKMPQKSTYFYPKLISGLIVNKIDRKKRSKSCRMYRISARQRTTDSALLTNCRQALLKNQTTGYVNGTQPVL